MVSEAVGVGAARGDPDKNGISGVWVDIRGLGKHFAGEVALRDVDMDIVRGEVHGLVGANGAGKSTLIRCLAGVTVPDEGKIMVDGEELRLGSPQASEKAGLAFIHQELNLVPHFSALAEHAPWRAQGDAPRIDRLETFEPAPRGPPRKGWESSFPSTRKSPTCRSASVGSS